MKTIGDFLSDWKHIVLVLGLLLIAAFVGAFVPADRWDKLATGISHFLENPQAAVATATTLGSIAAAFWAAFRHQPAPALPVPVRVVQSPPPLPVRVDAPAATDSTPTNPVGTRRDGFARIDSMFVVGVTAFVFNIVIELVHWLQAHVMLLVLVAIGVSVSGCGASALSQHASGVAITMIAVAGAEDAYLADLDASEHGCSDEACVTAARASHAPAEAAIELTRTAVLSWRDAVEVALAASDETSDLLAALSLAAARVLARWAEVATALEPLGIHLPFLPPLIATLVPGGAS